MRLPLRGVSSAFRAPTLREVSANYGTSTERGAGIIYGNPDLKPEKVSVKKLILPITMNRALMRA